MATAEKTASVEELSATLEQAKGIYLTDFTGLTVAQMSELRRTCRSGKIEYKVVKRTLLQRAARERGLTALEAELAGPCGLAVSKTDELGPARVLTDFAKANERFKIRLAVIDGRVIPEQGVKTLAMLPARPVLQAQMLGALTAPAASFVGILQAPIQALLSVLSQRGQGAETESAEPAAAEGAATEAAGT